jgi:hypothetical protein
LFNPGYAAKLARDIEEKPRKISAKYYKSTGVLVLKMNLFRRQQEENLKAERDGNIIILFPSPLSKSRFE